jgi:hypothetical protein
MYKKYKQSVYIGLKNKTYDKFSISTKSGVKFFALCYCLKCFVGYFPKSKFSFRFKLFYVF